MKFGDYEFERISEACPEQYEVWDKNHTHVGYVRLRHGVLSAECPDVGCTIVYEERDYFHGMGYFEDDEDRTYFLNVIADAIKNYYERNGNDMYDEEMIGILGQLLDEHEEDVEMSEKVRAGIHKVYKALVSRMH